MNFDWMSGLPGGITVCDRQGIIVAMNEQAAESYRKDGGKALIGKNLLDCHPEPSRTKVRRLLESGERNIYTIEKNGVKKLIYQVPWYQDGRNCGLIELALEIPFEMPHFLRQ